VSSFTGNTLVPGTVLDSIIESSPVFTLQGRGGTCLPAWKMSSHMLGGTTYQSLKR